MRSSRLVRASDRLCIHCNSLVFDLTILRHWMEADEEVLNMVHINGPNLPVNTKCWGEKFSLFYFFCYLRVNLKKKSILFWDKIEKCINLLKSLHPTENAFILSYLSCSPLSGRRTLRTLRRRGWGGREESSGSENQPVASRHDQRADYSHFHI
jgi:hypothetical protein